MSNARMSWSASVLFCFLTPHPALAQGSAPAFPSRTTIFIAPFSPGGPVDVESRIYAKKWIEMTGQKVVVDYKPGAASSIGAAFVAKSPADGYTLLIGTAGFPLMPVLAKDLPFDVLKDFTPISQMSARTTVLLTRPAFPPKNFREYVDYAKKYPGKITYGFSGASLVAGSWLHSLNNVKVTYIGYKGVGSATADLLGGRLDVLPSTLAVALPLIKAGKAGGLVILSSRRTNLLPNLQTVGEQLPEFEYAGNWFGLLAPGGTPADVVDKLSKLFMDMAKAPDVVSQLDAQGSFAVGNTPADFKKLISTEVSRWQRVMKENGINLEDN